MARGRMITQDCARDPHLNALSLESELLYLLTLPHLDRDGLVDGDPTLLAATSAPRRTQLRDRAGALINEWVETGLVIRYAWRDGPILFFKGFRKHNQKLRYEEEQPSRFPPPDDWHREEFGLCPDEPDLAAHVALHLDTRSSYAKGLLAFAQQQRRESARRGCSPGAQQTSTKQKPDKKAPRPPSVPEGAVATRLAHEDVRLTKHQQNRTSTSTSTQLDDDEGLPPHEAVLHEDEHTTARNLALEIAKNIPSWTGAGKFIDELTPHQRLDALTWLWLWEVHRNPTDPIDQWRAHQRYNGDPFDGIASIPGKIITQVRLGNAAPLHAHDLEELYAYLAGPEERLMNQEIENRK